MDNYKVLDKLRKTRECTYYSAVNRQTNRPVTLLKLNSKRVTWQELFSRRDVALMKQAGLACLPRLVEIIKDEGQFFLVVEKLDNNLEDYRRGTRLPLAACLEVAILLLQALLELSKKEILVFNLRPEHIFYEQGKLTLTSVGSSQRDVTKFDLLESHHDLRYVAPQNILTSKAVDDRSNVFTVGCILAELVLNCNLIRAKTKMDYVYAVTELFPKQHPPNKDTDEVDHAHSFEARIANQCSKELQAVLIDMLKVNPAERLAVEESIERLSKLDPTRLSHSQIEKTQQAEKTSLKVSAVQEIKKSRVEPKLQTVTVQPAKKTQHSRVDTKESKKLPEVGKAVPIEPKNLAKDQSQPLNFQDHDDTAISRMLEMLKLTKPLRSEQNIEDDVTQAIIIKKSEARELPSLNVTPGRLRPVRGSVGRPQLTNFALNDGNLGVQLGSSFFSDNDNMPF